MAEEAAFKISLYAKSDVGAVRPGNEDNFLVLNLSTADTWKPADHDSNAPNNLTNFNQSHYGSVVAVTDGMGGGGAGGGGGRERGPADGRWNACAIACSSCRRAPCIPSCRFTSDSGCRSSLRTSTSTK